MAGVWQMVKIDGRIIGGANPTFIIAEIGINHNGDLNIAKKLIDAAVEAGCDAVKFQKREVGLVYSMENLDRPRESPFGTTNRELKYGLEFGFSEYCAINSYCRERQILWFASCWDQPSVDLIEQFDPPLYKSASACLTDHGLLRKMKATGKPLMISTGMSEMSEIEAAIQAIGTENLLIAHSSSAFGGVQSPRSMPYWRPSCSR